MTTVVAMEAQETVREDAAAQEGMKRLFDESWDWLFSGSCAGEEGLELLANDAVQEGLLRRARCVAFLGLHGIRMHRSEPMRRACRSLARRWSFSGGFRARAFTSA